MTNQHQSWKWDAEAAFKRIEAFGGVADLAAANDAERMKAPYTPPPNVAAWLKAQADKPKPHGRDIESLMRYHKAHERDIGYWEDAPRGMKFGGSGGKPTTASHKAAQTTPQGPAREPSAAPTTPPADGLWPKYALSPSHERKGLSVVFIQAEAGGTTTAYYTDGTKMRYRAPNGVLAFGAICTDIGVIIRALEQNGHADVAAQLRWKAADDDLYEPVGTMPVVGDRVVRVKNDRFTWSAKIGEVFDIINPRFDNYYSFAAQGGGHGELEDRDFGTWRILKRPTKPRDDVATGARVWAEEGSWWRVQIGGRHYIKPHTQNRSWPYARGWAESAPELDKSSPTIEAFCRGRGAAELHGTERDAIVAECCAAMKLDRKTGEPINK